MHFKNHINNLVRLQTSQNRDLINGILLDRNERADSFNNLAFKKALKSFPKILLMLHQIFPSSTKQSQIFTS